MTSRLSRRQVLRAGVGGLAALSLAPRTTAQKQATLDPKEANHIAKHAAIRVGIYTKFADRFGLTDQMLYDQFRESLPFGGARSLSDVSLRDLFLFLADLGTKGLAGDVLTLQWYQETRAMSQIGRAYDQGVITSDVSSSWGGNKQASKAASAENQTLAQKAAAVAKAADAYQATPSNANQKRVVQALAAEAKALQSNTETIASWSSIRPSNYPASKGAEKVKTIAQANVEALSAFRETVQRHHTATQQAQIQLLIPGFLAGYEANIDQARAEIPETLRGLVFGERMNLYLMTQTGSKQKQDIKRAAYVSTASNGHLKEYHLIPQEDADVHIYTTKQVLRDIATAERPGQAAKRALEQDRIMVDGQGIVNDVKYGGSTFFAENGQEIVNGVTEVIEGVENALEEWL